MIRFVTNGPLPSALPKPVLTRVGRALGRALHLRKDQEVGVRFVREAEMRRLNKTYRGTNRPTDVLSFSSDATAYLGDLALCLPYASKEAKRRAIPLAEELVRLLIHGTLHLAGHDHATAKEEERMFALQERLVEACI